MASGRAFYLIGLRICNVFRIDYSTTELFSQSAWDDGV